MLCILNSLSQHGGNRPDSIREKEGTMDDPFFAEDDGEFDDIYGNGARSARPSQTGKPEPSQSRRPPVHEAPSPAYPDTPASSVASFASRSTDGGLMSVSTVTPRPHSSERTQKRHKKMRRRRSQERFEVEWENDDDVSACFVCSNEFSLLKRKHHCRHCGRVICSDCSSFRRLSSSRAKHRVCSFCSVDLANGVAHHTIAGRTSTSDAEMATPNYIGRQDMVGHRKSTAGGYKSRDRNRSQDATVLSIPTPSSRRDKPNSVLPQEHTNELFDTSDDTWFSEPLDDGGGGGQRSRGAAKNDHIHPASTDRNSYARPRIVKPPDSLFDVHFTNGNPSDDASDDRDVFSMPRPLEGAVVSNDFAQSAHVSSLRTTSGTSALRMTVDELNSSSTPASYVTAAHTFQAAVVVAPRSSRTAERTFYNDDADQIVVDEAPGFYDSVVIDRHNVRSSTPAYSNPAQMPRPSTLAAVSDGSSGTLIDAPDMSTPIALAVVDKRDNSPPRKRGFAGAIKRLFGISKTKNRDPPISTPTQAITTPAESVPPADSSNKHLAVDDGSIENHPPAQMPRPDLIPAPIFDHYDKKNTSDETVRRLEHEEVLNDRYTIADVGSIMAESKGASSTASFRHTMGGYSIPTAQAPMENSDMLIRASVNEIDRSSQLKDEKKKSRRSNRSRRDTFDDLFNSPKKGSRQPVSTPAAVPTRSWATVPDGSRSAVGVDRFDRPRQEDPNDDIALNLGLPLGERENTSKPRSPTRTPWSAVSSYRGVTDVPSYATPNSFMSTRVSGYYDSPQTLGDTGHADESSVGFDSTSNDEPNRTIMDDLKPSSTTLGRRTERQRDSVDDYFADFEKQTEYVFDSTSGTYVPTNAAKTSQSFRQTSTTGSSAKSLLRSEPNQAPFQGRYDQATLNSSADASEALRDGVSDEIDGIIADKISTLAGELEALKQLLRQRRSGVSTGPRKESIFDNDSSEEEKNPPVKKMGAKYSRSSRRRTSHPDTNRQKIRRRRKDSFAGLFEDEDEPSDRKGVLSTNNYEALFRIGQKHPGSPNDSDDDVVKPSSRRKRSSVKYGDQHLSDPDSERDRRWDHDTQDDFPDSSRFSRPGKANNLNSPSPQIGDDSTGRSTAKGFDYPQLHRQASKQKSKKDAIDSLFDSDTEQDMGELYATSVPSHATTSAPTSREQTSESENDAKSPKGMRNLERGNSQEGRINVKLSAASDSADVSTISSDEELTSTLKNLRARRLTRTREVKSSGSLFSPDSSETEELTAPSRVPTLMSSTSVDIQPIPSHGGVVDSSAIVFEKGVKPVETIAADRNSVIRDSMSSSRDASIAEAYEITTEVVVDPASLLRSSLYEEIVAERPEHVEGGDSTAETAYEHSSLQSFVKGKHEFDPLALSDEEAEVKSSSKDFDKKLGDLKDSSAPGWGMDVESVGNRLKALRFRDDLLDSSPLDALDKSPSLDLDDLLSDGGIEQLGASGSDEDWRKSMSDEDESFNFEIKPKNRASSAQKEITVLPSNKLDSILPFDHDREQVSEHEDGAIIRPDRQDAITQDEMEILESESDISVERDTVGGTMSFASSIDDGEAPPIADSAQFQDDWQRMQEEERDRKKKLQLKQRQAQREKLKKQASSARTLGKLSSSRIVASPATGSSSSTSVENGCELGDENFDGSKVKKKKKHHKKTEEGHEEDGDQKSRRKSEKRRHRRDVAKGGKEAPHEVPPQSILTEL